MDIFNSASCYILEGFHSGSSADGGGAGFGPSTRGIWDTFSVVALLGSIRFFLSVPASIKHSAPKLSALQSRVWFGVIVFYVTFLLTIDSIKSVERFQQRITSLEFTAIAVAIYRFCYNFKNIFVVIKIFHVRDKLSHLLSTVSKLCVPPHETHDVSLIIRRKVRRLAVLLLLSGATSVAAVQLACFTTFRGIVKKRQAIDPSCSWTCSTAYPIFGSAPIWLTFASYLCGFVMAVGVDVFPQLLIILIIYPLGLRFVHFTESIKNLVKHGPPFSYNSAETGMTAVLRRQTGFHLQLSQLVLGMDKTFSLLFFLMYTGDLMGFIATASLFLHHKSSMNSGSIDLELMPIFASLMCVSSFHAVLRTSFGIWLNERAHSVLPYLYELNLKSTSEEDKFLCSSFISRLQGSRVALTAGGFFYITREFVITIFGVLLTYVLFVYQMQDQKQDMSLLPKLDEIAALAFTRAQKIMDGDAVHHRVVCPNITL